MGWTFLFHTVGHFSCCSWVWNVSFLDYLTNCSFFEMTLTCLLPCGGTLPFQHRIDIPLLNAHLTWDRLLILYRIIILLNYHCLFPPTINRDQSDFSLYFLKPHLTLGIYYQWLFKTKKFKWWEPTLYCLLCAWFSSKSFT